jgi:hypothetical protein
MKLFVVTLGALLLAAPIFSQQEAVHEALLFSLNEQRAQVERRMGSPAMIAQHGDLESWQYQIGLEDHHEFSHQLVFRISTGALISFTRNYEVEESVDELFPAGETRVEHFPDTEHSVMRMRVRRMDGGRVLLALGGFGEPTTQVMMIREAELKHFHEWLWQRLGK